MTYYLYILKCKNGSFYTGITTDVKRRFEEHKSGKGGRYTRAAGVSKVVYIEKHKDRSAASKREAAVKKLSRADKLSLIRA